MFALSFTVWVLVLFACGRVSWVIDMVGVFGQPLFLCLWPIKWCVINNTVVLGLSSGSRCGCGDCSHSEVWVHHSRMWRQCASCDLLVTWLWSICHMIGWLTSGGRHTLDISMTCLCRYVLVNGYPEWGDTRTWCLVMTAPWRSFLAIGSWLCHCVCMSSLLASW